MTGPWKGALVIATVSGSVFAGLLQAVGQTPSPVTVLTGVLSGISVFLFSMFIRQGNRLAALEAYSKRNKDDIDKLDEETRTVDKRIESSRHLVRNELTGIVGEAEIRVMTRYDEMRERTARMEERLHRHLEGAKP